MSPDSVVCSVGPIRSEIAEIPRPKLVSGIEIFIKKILVAP